MYPNADRYNPDTEYANKLVDRIGQTPAWIALRLGVTEKRMRYILAGSRTIKGDTTEILMSYAEQFCLECLAAVGATLIAGQCSGRVVGVGDTAA